MTFDFFYGFIQVVIETDVLVPFINGFFALLIAMVGFLGGGEKLKEYGI